MVNLCQARGHLVLTLVHMVNSYTLPFVEKRNSTKKLSDLAYVCVWLELKLLNEVLKSLILIFVFMASHVIGGNNTHLLLHSGCLGSRFLPRAREKMD